MKWGTNSGGGLTQSIWDVINDAWNQSGEYGGVWHANKAMDGGGTVTPFSSENEAFGYGLGQMTANNWFGASEGWATSAGNAFNYYVKAEGIEQKVKEYINDRQYKNAIDLIIDTYKDIFTNPRNEYKVSSNSFFGSFTTRERDDDGLFLSSIDEKFMEAFANGTSIGSVNLIMFQLFQI